MNTNRKVLLIRIVIIDYSTDKRIEQMSVSIQNIENQLSKEPK